MLPALNRPSVYRDRNARHDHLETVPVVDIVAAVGVVLALLPKVTNSTKELVAADDPKELFALGTKFIRVRVVGSAMHVRPGKLIQCNQSIGRGIERVVNACLLD